MRKTNADVAQSAEQPLCKRWVAGSTPAVGSKRVTMLKQHAIFCIECGAPIRSRRDLVTAWHFLAIRPFHKACVGNVRVLLSCLIVCFLLFLGISRFPPSAIVEFVWAISELVLFIFVFAILPRLLSWLWYERRLSP